MQDLQSSQLPTPQAMERYTAHFQQRRKNDLLEKQQRFQHAWKQAKFAAQILKTHFGIKQVFLFGSLLTPTLFDAHSDIDLAVEALPLDQYCGAVGMLLLEVKGFNIDLIRLESSPSSLKAHILQEGVRL